MSDALPPTTSEPAPFQPIDFGTWESTPEAARVQDPLQKIQAYDNRLRKDLFAAGMYDAEAEAEITAAGADQALRQGLIASPEEYAPVAKPRDPGFLARQLTRKGDSAKAQDIFRYQSFLSRPDTDPETLERARLAAQLDPETENELVRSAVRSGELPFAVVPDKDGNPVFEIDPELGALDRQQILDLAGDDIDPRFLPDLEKQLTRVTGTNYTPAQFRQAAVFDSFLKRQSAEDPFLGDVLQRAQTEYDRTGQLSTETQEELDRNLAALDADNEFAPATRARLIRDTIKRGSKPEAYDPENPQQHIQYLEDGTVWLPEQVIFDQTKHDALLDSLDITPEQREAAKKLRAGRLDAIAPSMVDAMGADPDALEFFEKSKASGKTDAEIATEWYSKPENYGSFSNRARSFGMSLIEAGPGLVQSVAALAGSDSAREALAARAQDTARNEEYARLFGDSYGVGQSLLNTSSQVAADLLAGLAVSAVATPVAGAAVAGSRTAASSLVRGLARTALTEGARSTAAGFLRSATGSAARTLATMGDDVATNLARSIASQTGVAASSFTRSAGSAYVQAYSALDAQTNAQGQPLYSDAEKRKIALGTAMTAGTATAAITLGFGKLLGPGVEGLVTGKLGTSALRRLFGATDDQIISATRESALAILKSAGQEAPEEAVDQLVGNVIQAVGTGEEFRLGPALKEALEAGLVGGLLGAGTKSIELGVDKFRSPRVEALEKAGAPATAAALEAKNKAAATTPAAKPTVINQDGLRIQDNPPLSPDPFTYGEEDPDAPSPVLEPMAPPSYEPGDLTAGYGDEPAVGITDTGGAVRVSAAEIEGQIDAVDVQLADLKVVPANETEGQKARRTRRIQELSAEKVRLKAAVKNAKASGGFVFLNTTSTTAEQAALTAEAEVAALDEEIAALSAAPAKETKAAAAKREASLEKVRAARAAAAAVAQTRRAAAPIPRGAEPQSDPRALDYGDGGELTVQDNPLGGPARPARAVREPRETELDYGNGGELTVQDNTLGGTPSVPEDIIGTDQAPEPPVVEPGETELDYGDGGELTVQDNTLGGPARPARTAREPRETELDYGDGGELTVQDNTLGGPAPVRAPAPTPTTAKKPTEKQLAEDVRRGKPLAVHQSLFDDTISQGWVPTRNVLLNQLKTAGYGGQVYGTAFSETVQARIRELYPLVAVPKTAVSKTLKSLGLLDIKIGNKLVSVPVNPDGTTAPFTNDPQVTAWQKAAGLSVKVPAGVTVNPAIKVNPKTGTVDSAIDQTGRAIASRGDIKRPGSVVGDYEAFQNKTPFGVSLMTLPPPDFSTLPRPVDFAGYTIKPGETTEDDLLRYFVVAPTPGGQSRLEQAIESRAPKSFTSVQKEAVRSAAQLSFIREIREFMMGVNAAGNVDAAGFGHKTTQSYKKYLQDRAATVWSQAGKAKDGTVDTSTHWNERGRPSHLSFFVDTAIKAHADGASRRTDANVQLGSDDVDQETALERAAARNEAGDAGDTLVALDEAFTPEVLRGAAALIGTTDLMDTASGIQILVERLDSVPALRKAFEQAYVGSLDLPPGPSARRALAIMQAKQMDASDLVVVAARAALVQPGVLQAVREAGFFKSLSYGLNTFTDAEVEQHRADNRAAIADLQLDGDLRSALERIARSAKYPRRYRSIMLAALKMPVLPNLAIIDAPTEAYAGSYTRSANLVTLNIASSNGRGLLDVLAHELLHAATIDAVANPQTRAARELRDRLERARQKAADVVPADMAYAVSSLDEFITHAATDPRLQVILRETFERGKSTWQRVVEAIARFFGIANNDFVSDLWGFINHAAEYGLRPGVAASREPGPLSARFRPSSPDIRYSMPAPARPRTRLSEQTKARTVAGTTVGTRNPTGKKVQESGTDRSLLVDRASMRRDQALYRKNAVLVADFPLVAAQVPNAARIARDLKAPVIAAKAAVDAAAARLASARDAARSELARMTGVRPTKVKAGEIDRLEAGDIRVKRTDTATKAALREIKAARKALETARKNLKARDEKFKEASKALIASKRFPIELADQVYDALEREAVRNLEALVELFPADLRDTARLWYDGANIIAQDFAERFNTNLNRASAVLAVFSPQKDWFMNVALAERMMNVWANHQDTRFDDAMAANYLKRAGEPEVLWDKKLDTEQRDAEGNIKYTGGARPVYDENGDIVDWENWDSTKAQARFDQARKDLAIMQGRKLSELSPDLQARFIRMWSEVYDKPAFKVVSPDGSFGDNKLSESGNEQRIAWGSYVTINKAIAIMTADTASEMDVISTELGSQHKVRSFYNNIVDPDSADGHVTMDTHAIAAVLWLPLSGNSPEVTMNFGGGGSSGSSILGLSGLYPAFAEAYREVAAKFGLLPREIQSITWESVRLLFPAKFKSQKANVDSVREVWRQFEQGNLTTQQAHDRIFQLVDEWRNRGTGRPGRTASEAVADGTGVGDTDWAAIARNRNADLAAPQGADDAGGLPAGGRGMDGTGRPPVGRRGAGRDAGMVPGSPEGGQSGPVLGALTPDQDAVYASFMARYRDTPSVQEEKGGRYFSPIVRDLLNRRAAGEAIPRFVLDRAVKEHFPSSRVAVPKSAADLPSEEAVLGAIDAGQRQRHAKAEEAGPPTPGSEVTVRQDVPAWKNNRVGVVTTQYKVGKETYTTYRPATKIENPVFDVSRTEKATELIGRDVKPKGPHIVITGTWSADQSIPSDLESWTQVGFNPDRHSYYYERGTERMVVGGRTAFQIGNTVFVKDAVFDDAGQADTRYAQAPRGTSTNVRSPIDQHLPKLPDGLAYAYDETRPRYLAYARRSQPGTVTINRAALASLVEGLDPANARAIVRKIVNHEIAHLAAFQAFTDAELDEMAAALSTSELADIARKYYGTPDSMQRMAADLASGTLTRAALVEEWLRSVAELVTDGGTTEETIAFHSANPGMVARILRYIRDYVRALWTRVAGPKEDFATRVSINRLMREYRDIKRGHMPPVAEPFDTSDPYRDNKLGALYDGIRGGRREITPESRERAENSPLRKKWVTTAKRVLGVDISGADIPVDKIGYLRVSDFPESVRDLATLKRAQVDLDRETDMAGNEVFDALTTEFEDAAWNDLDAGMRNAIRSRIRERNEALARIQEKTKGVYTDSEIMNYVGALPSLTELDLESMRLIDEVRGALAPAAPADTDPEATVLSDIMRRETFIDFAGAYTAPAKGWKGTLKQILQTRTGDPRFEAVKNERTGRLNAANQLLANRQNAMSKAIKAEKPDRDLVNRALGDSSPTIPTAVRKQLRADYESAVGRIRAFYNEQAQDANADLEQIALDEKAALREAYAEYDKLRRDALVETARAKKTAISAAMEELRAVAPQTAAAVKKFRSGIDSLSKVMRDTHAEDSFLHAVIDENLGVYLTRTYRAHHGDGDPLAILNSKDPADMETVAAAEKLFVDTIVEGRAEEIVEEEAENDRYISFDEALELARAWATENELGRRALEDYIASHGSRAFYHGGGNFKIDLTRYMQKVDVPEALRKVLGEVNDPVENAARTFANVAHMAANFRFIEDLARGGKSSGALVTKAQKDGFADMVREPDEDAYLQQTIDYGFARRKPAAGYVKVAEDIYHPAWLIEARANRDFQMLDAYEPLATTSAKYGAGSLDGLFAAPLVKALYENSMPKPPTLESEKMVHRFGSFFAKATGFSLGVATVTNPAFHARNALGGTLFLGANGVNPFAGFGTVSQHFADLVAGKDNPEVTKRIALGIYSDDIRPQAIKELIKDEIDKPGDKSGFEWFGSLIAGKKGERIGELVAAGALKLTDVASAIDSVLKGRAYEAELETLRKAYPDGSKTESELERMAAGIVKRTMQSRSMTVPIAEDVTRSSFGRLFAPFLRFKAEMFRITHGTVSQALDEIKSGNPVLRARGYQRMSGFVLVAAASLAGPALISALMGVGEEEEIALREALPPYLRGNSMVYVASGGSITSLDLTFVNPYSMIFDPVSRSARALLRGEADKAPGELASWLHGQFLEEQIAAGAVLEVLNNRTSDNKPITLETDGFGDQVVKYSKHLLGSAYTPQVLKIVDRAIEAQRRGVPEDAEFFETPAGVLSTAIVPARPRTYEASELALRAFKSKAQTLRDIRTKQGRLKIRQNLDAQDVNEIVLDQFESMSSLYEDLGRIARGYEGLGLTKAQVIKEMVNAGHSREKARGVVAAGYVPAPSLTPATKRDIFDAGQEVDKNGGGERRVRLIIEAQRVLPRVIEIDGAEGED